jgi:hypothetical protein
LVSQQGNLFPDVDALKGKQKCLIFAPPVSNQHRGLLVANKNCRSWPQSFWEIRQDFKLDLTMNAVRPVKPACHQKYRLAGRTRACG